ncbi:thioesterase family protein [[Pseudomonas] boreopolis]|uniref:thioesterase family protein n=1 Tax=Xanthomonas boreopolis TaxID=86183 RepID=UPI003D9BC402
MKVLPARDYNEAAMTSLSHTIERFDPNAEFLASPEWFQGRTIYGGLTAALALQAVLHHLPGVLPPLKSALISFVGPAAGPLRFRPQLLRKGKSAAFVSVDCLAGADMCLRAEFLFATQRLSRVQHDFHARPETERPDHYARFDSGGKAPASLGNFDLRPTGRTLPLSGAVNPELIAWLRHEDASGVDPTVALIALADGLPPAAISTITDMVPFSSMTWTIDLPRPAEIGEWHLLRSTSQHASNGYSFQVMEIWDEAGRLALAGSQTVAVFD